MWRNLPLALRAVLLGLLVSGIPTVIWGVLAAINLKTTPSLPWSAAVMTAVLLLYWGVIRSNDFRRQQMRAVELKPGVWRLALLAGGSGIAAIWALFAVLRGILHVAPPSGDLNSYPVLTVAVSLIMGSLVAGIAEEAGFRGYMQVPLERAYGPVAAITTTSIIFTLTHLTHGARILPFLPFFFGAAVIYGLLAYLTGSLLPSMTLHFVGDVMMFAMRYLAARQGVGGGAVPLNVALCSALAFVALAGLSVMAFRQLAHGRHSEEPAAPAPAIG